MALLPVGHGAEDRDALGARLTAAGVDRIVDVRRFPGSRSNPDVRSDALEEWLPAAGIGYRWEERLGGRRRLPRDEPVADDWWTVAQFAASAAHTRTQEFGAALDAVLEAAADSARTSSSAALNGGVRVCAAYAANCATVHQSSATGSPAGSRRRPPSRSSQR